MGNQFTRYNRNMYGRNVKKHVVHVRNPIQVAHHYYDNKLRVEQITLPDPGGAAVDSPTNPVWVAPEDGVIRAVKFHQLIAATANPAAATNDMDVTVSNGTGSLTIVTKNFVAAVDSTPTSLGTVSNVAFVKGDLIRVLIDQKGSCDIGTTMLTIEWSPQAEDHAGHVIFVAPQACTLKRVLFTPDSAKIEAAAATNDMVITVKNATGPVTIVAKTLVADVAVSTPTDLGTFTGSPALAADDKVTVDFTINGTAYLPSGTFQVEYYATPKTFTGKAIFKAREKCTVEKIQYVGEQTSAGVDGSNTAVIAVKNATDATTIVSKTYNASGPPAANTYADLGTLANADLDANDVLTLDETLGVTAFLGDHRIEIDYVLQDVEPS